MRGSGWIIGFAALMASGCVAVQQQAVSPAPPPARVAMLPPPSARIFNKAVAAGSTTLLNTATSLNPDCSLVALPTARVTQEPVHGTVRFVREDIFPTYRPNDPHAGCNKVKAPSLVAEYTPAPGFIGTDFAILEYIFKDGRDVQLKFAITVK